MNMVTKSPSKYRRCKAEERIKKQNYIRFKNRLRQGRSS